MALVLTREALSNLIEDDLATRNVNAGLIEAAVDAKIAKTTDVTAINDASIADGEIAVFNKTAKDIRTSAKTIVTTIGATDATVPTSKAIVDEYASTANAKGASLVGIEDAGGFYAGTDTEAALQEVGASFEDTNIEIAKTNFAMNNLEAVVQGLNDNQTTTAYDEYGSIVPLGNRSIAGCQSKQEGLVLTNFDTIGSTESTLTTAYAAYQTSLSALANSTKVFVSALIFQETGKVVKLQFGDTEVTCGTTSNVYARYSYVGTYNSAHTNKTKGFFVDSAGTSKVKDQITINLTALGLASVSAADMALATPVYFDGTKNAVSLAAVCVGKNLFDKDSLTDVYNGFFATTTTILTANATTRTVFSKFMVPANTVITCSKVGGTRNTIGFVTSKTTGATVENISGTSPVTSPNYPSYVAYYVDTVSTMPTSIQIEKSSTATTYEAFKSSIQYVEPYPMYHTPNSTEDSIESGGYVKRVSDLASISGTVYASVDNATYTNVEVVKTTAFSLASAGTTAANGMTHYYDKNGALLSEVASADIDLTASIGKYYYHTDKTVWIIVAKDAYADIAAARTGLGTSTLYYQLATPITTPNVTSGVPIAYPSGTVYYEPRLADADVYTDKFSIMRTSYPIDSLVSITKVNDDGTYTTIPISTATIAGDGLSFTHASLTADDLVLVEYLWDYVLPYGFKTVTAYNSPWVVLDTANSKYYKMGFSTTNGTAAMTATEVT